MLNDRAYIPKSCVTSWISTWSHIIFVLVRCLTYHITTRNLFWPREIWRPTKKFHDIRYAPCQCPNSHTAPLHDCINFLFLFFTTFLQIFFVQNAAKTPHRAKLYWNLIWKNPGLIPFWANWPLWAQIWHLWGRGRGSPGRNIKRHEKSMKVIQRQARVCW